MSMETTFTFKAVRRDGALEIGVVEAPSREAAAALIASSGGFALELSVQSPARRPGRRTTAEDLALGLRSLATLLASGIPVARALALLDDLAPESWRAVLPEIRRRVEQGENLGTALEASPLPLPPHIVGIVEAGEAGGGLVRAVERAAQLLEIRSAHRAELRKALAYPLVLALAGWASLTLLVGIVLPRFADLLADTGQQLPASTRVVLAVGAAVHAGWLPGLLGFFLAVAVWQAWVTKPAGQARWHQLLLRTPIIGGIRQSAATGNSCAALSALLDAGVPLAQALPPAARASGDRAMESSLVAARQRIALGAALSSALRAESAMTLVVIQMVRLGEDTGRLSEMLAHGGALESARAIRLVQRVVQIIEPALILLFGGLVMIVAAALMQAMYGLRAGG